ncbi:ABC transporter permease [Sporolactobacillus shoreicorticis]|uniref:ABC transporter permease n=1 Tax=Sporolactobacillus shoreicorticis TaxID=1923877 RepID=A0ABW5S490_9BACL|nr:ABC transporter permease [Sporolactobacillus shoreicorticis]MCO7127075.1 ABC transporter permease [Sporolactobacillus shoreicorticis]
MELTKISFKKYNGKRLNAEELSGYSATYWKDVWRRLMVNPTAMLSLAALVIIIILVIIGPLISGHDISSINPRRANLNPSLENWFGTDNLGRDLFTRVWYGARASIIVALVCTLIQTVTGCLYGGVMAYFGGWVDEVLMRIIEVMTSMPTLLITILTMMVLGNGMVALLVAMSVTSWCGTARLIRGQVMQLREAEYVLAAVALGASPFWVILKHLIPNTFGLLMLTIATSIPDYIFTEAGLSFLGIGLQPPNTSLGVLISIGQQTMDFFPIQLLVPGLILCTIVLAFNLLGDGLRDALDPRMRQ